MTRAWTPERWAALDQAVEAAMALPTAERAAALDLSLGSDPALRAEASHYLATTESDSRWQAIAGRSAADLEAKDEDPGSRIGPYEVIRKIGEGGMGDVYLVRHDEAGFRHEAAMKLVRRGAADPFCSTDSARSATSWRAEGLPAVDIDWWAIVTNPPGVTFRVGGYLLTERYWG